MRSLSALWGAVLLAVLAYRIDARDVWVVRGLAEVESQPCSEAVSADVLRWNADAVFHNLSGSDRSVTVLETSNSGSRRGVVAVGSGRSRALSLDRDLPDLVSGSDIWVTKLDVPEGVHVEGRLEFIFDVCHGTQPPNTTAAGAVALPVFEHLTAPHQPQIHFGTDLGVQPARYNVGIYNAAEIQAIATIEVTRPACLGDAKVTRTLTIPARTLVQESLFGIDMGCAGQLNDTGVAPWVTYTTVTVDQPSLSYVIALAGGGRPQVTLGFGTQ
jgi:hypothetical protein